MKRSQIKIFLKKFVMSSAMFSRAVTTTLPMFALPPENAWAAARRDFDVAQSQPDFASMQAWLKQELGKRPVAEVVMASYAVPGIIREELDRFWMGRAETSRDSTIIDAMIAVNSHAVKQKAPTTREDFLAQWLVKTSACYGNCGIGQGNGGGNGTPNEGHHHH